MQAPVVDALRWANACPLIEQSTAWTSILTSFGLPIRHLIKLNTLSAFLQFVSGPAALNSIARASKVAHESTSSELKTREPIAHTGMNQD